MRKYLIFLCIIFDTSIGLFSQTVGLELPDTIATSGEVITIPVLVNGFNEINTVQFSIAWDSSFELIQVEPLSQIQNIIIATFDDHFNCSWIGPTDGLTLEDGTALLEITLETVGCPGDSNAIRFAPEFLATEITQANNGMLEFLTVDTTSSYNTIIPMESLSLADTLLCDPDTLFVLAECMGCTDFVWSTGEVTPGLWIDSSGTYTVQAIHENDCVFEDSVVVSIDTFRVEELADTALCPDAATFLSLQEIYSQYNWSTGDTLSYISVDEPGLYTVTVTNANACEAIDSSVITALPLPLATAFAEPPLLCPGDSLFLSADTAYVDSITWYQGGEAILAEGEVDIGLRPDSAQTYYVVVQNGCGVDTAFTSIEIIAFEADAGRDTCIGPGQEIQLNAIGGVAYQWLDNQYPVSNPSIADPLVQPQDSSFFFVQVTSSEGCILVDSVLIAVADAPEVFIKKINLITPNNDGYNDDLFFPGLEKFPDNQLQIFNRWGQLVFEKEGYQQDEEYWDGTINGRPLPAGEYFYMLEISDALIQQTISIFRE
jgi:gliding motility-associated-like protein